MVCFVNAHLRETEHEAIPLEMWDVPRLLAVEPVTLPDLCYCTPRRRPDSQGRRRKLDVLRCQLSLAVRPPRDDASDRLSDSLPVMPQNLSPGGFGRGRGLQDSTQTATLISFVSQESTLFVRWETTGQISAALYGRIFAWSSSPLKRRILTLGRDFLFPAIVAGAGRERLSTSPVRSSGLPSYRPAWE
jgi:hypothetical protein